MFKLTNFKGILILIGAISVMASGIVYAQEEMGTDHIGEESFQTNCAACHGKGGKGDGPFVEFLRQKPADLTLISQRHGGVYPQAKIYSWIRDPEKIRAHGTEEMPIWGDKFSKEIIEYYGPDYTGPGSSVQQRILELVFYIGTIQQ